MKPKEPQFSVCKSKATGARKNPAAGRYRNLIEEINLAGKEKLNYTQDKAVYVVLEEDGTEVDEEEYFHTLPGKI